MVEEKRRVVGGTKRLVGRMVQLVQEERRAMWTRMACGTGRRGHGGNLWGGTNSSGNITHTCKE